MRSMIALMAVSLTVLPAYGAPEHARDQTSLSYISHAEGIARLTTDRGTSTIQAVRNLPVAVEERLDTAWRGRIELALADGTRVWLGEHSTVVIGSVAFSRNLPEEPTAIWLADGVAVVEIPASAKGTQIVTVHSPAGAVFLNGPGFHRLETRRRSVRIETHAGLAELPAGPHSHVLRAGQRAEVSLGGRPAVQALAGASDGFWDWVADRRPEHEDSESARRVAAPAHQTRLLDAHGEWVYVPRLHANLWRPREAADPSWSPYRHSRWAWTRVGCVWVADEVWGWLPHTHGTWIHDAELGWLWHWDALWGPSGCTGSTRQPTLAASPAGTSTSSSRWISGITIWTTGGIHTTSGAA